MHPGMQYVPAPPPADMEAVKRAAAQGQFLKEHLDLIIPFRFTVPQHVARRQGRLLRAWGEATVKMRNQRGTD